MFNDIRTKEYSIEDLFSKAYAVLTANKAWTLLMLTLAVGVSWIGTGFLNSVQSDISESQPIGIITSAIVGIVLALSGIIFNIAIIARTESVILKEDGLTVGQSLGIGCNRFMPAIGTSLLMILFLIPLFLLLILPGIHFAILWAFVLQVVALRGKAGLAALRYSRDIASGYYWKVFGVAIFAFIVQYVVGYALGLLAGMMNTSETTRSVLLTPFVQTIVIYSNMLMTVFFLNLEQLNARKQEAMATSAGDSPAQEVAGASEGV